MKNNIDSILVDNLNISTTKANVGYAYQAHSNTVFLVSEWLLSDLHDL
jgi:hypothetical protein